MYSAEMTPLPGHARGKHILPPPACTKSKAPAMLRIFRITR
jgi:hypothetical protein